MVGFCGTEDSVTFSASVKFTVWSLTHVCLSEKQEYFDLLFCIASQAEYQIASTSARISAYVPGFHRHSFSLLIAIFHELSNKESSGSLQKQVSVVQSFGF